MKSMEQALQELLKKREEAKEKHKICIEKRVEQQLKDKEKRKSRKKEKKKRYCRNYHIKRKRLENKLIRKQLAEAKKQYKINHPEEIIEQSTQYRLEYYQKNREEILKDQKKRRQKTKERIYNTNFKLRCNLRCRVLSALKGNSKSASTMELIGCSIKFARDYLESKFTERMTWDNHGTGYHGKGMKEWHIDHIKPCASFDLSKPEEQRKCFHYTNLQPLWATHNLIKSDNYI